MSDRMDDRLKQSASRAKATWNSRPPVLALASPTGKLPPQARELESAVLGALMLEKDALTTVIDILKPQSFYDDKHQRIFKAILNLFDKSEPIDILTVNHELREMGELEAAGGTHYVANLTFKVNSAANIEYHARIITENAIKRELIRIASDIHRDAFEDTTDVFNLLDQTEQALFEVSESNIRKNFDDMRSLMGKAIKELEEKKNQKDGLTGVPSGFSALDRVTSGWQPSDLVIIAARPGMGKCLGKGTKVLMYDGTLRNVEDVQAGQLLMGDDSTPRRVLSIARGQERMYWVRQNKAEDYRVNESHILSLKRSRNEGKHRNGDVLNITVKEWLAKSEKFRSSYKGYKVPVEFAEQELAIDPYFLGVWLGDGSSDNCRITAQDEEIISYLHEYAEALDMQVTVGVVENRCNSYGITRGRQGGSIAQYSLQDELRQLGVLGDKHIPQHYLINSTENRLRLLAGLIDSDGHLNVVSNGYEITQKNQKLARQIKFLCDSLGFRTALKKKRAVITSRGYESQVYRVRFYGDVNRIPVRVERKKANPWKSEVDWRMTGISVEFDKEDDYYGFEIDGNRLFLLQDMTVTHNTAFVVSAMRNAAVDHKKPVAIFSLEMSSIQLVNRLISAEAELDSEKIKKGNLADYEWAQLNHKISSLSSAPIFIDDTPALSIRELRTKCRRLKAHHDIQMIIIDYLQLMTGNADGGKGAGNREQEIASISRALKGIAKELNVPVLALSQLSRSVETRGGDKKPQLSDLRESGSIEQDADMVVFLYRPEYYKITEDEMGNPTQGMGEVIIAKHRNGSLETVQLKFIGRFTKFADLDGGGFGGDDFNTGAFPTSTFDDDASGFAPNTIRLGSRINNDTPPPQAFPRSNFGNEDPPF
ncbi:replicative DNA helicase [Hymenobacter cavernae]|nr:replicative DNA helicase [Hymenobacter cavernae]